MIAQTETGNENSMPFSCYIINEGRFSFSFLRFSSNRCYLPDQLVGDFTLGDLPHKPWSQGLRVDFVPPDLL